MIMKMDGAGILSIATAIAIVIVMNRILRFVKWIWFRPKKLEMLLRAQGFDGNSYRLLFGDLKDYSEMKKETKSKILNPPSNSNDILSHVLPYQQHIINKFGNASFVWFGPSPMLNITDPEQVREILSNPNTFHKPPYNPMEDIIIGGLFVSEGEKWARHRKIINPAFHLEKIKNMLPAMCWSCRDMISKWEMLHETDSDSFEIDVWPYLVDLTGDVISRSAFGNSIEEGRKIFHLQKEQINLAIQLRQLILIPGWRFLPTKTVRRFNQTCREIQSQLKAIITRREKAIEKGEANKDDLLGILLESNSKEMKDHGIGMSLNEVMEECKLFYLAGSETTSNLLAWTMVLLSIHLNWQRQAREEVLQVFGNGELDFDGLNRLKIVTMILYEVLRLYPPAPMFVRAISKETKLANITLPADTHFGLLIIHTHQDREIWGEDATEFKPERFSQGVSNATKGKASYFPFSGGPRVCVGQNFAMVDAKVAIAMILRRFFFELSPSYKHCPYQLFTLAPEFGAQLILRKI